MVFPALHGEQYIKVPIFMTKTVQQRKNMVQVPEICPENEQNVDIDDETQIERHNTTRFAVCVCVYMFVRVYVCLCVCIDYL